MKINFQKKFDQPAEFLLRRAGYGQIYDRRSGQTSYVRRLGGGHYPRFHLYVNSEDPLILNLHLDQKQVSYGGQTAHSGDYDSGPVKEEVERIYQAVKAMKDQPAPVRYDKQPEDEKKGFFKKLFG